MQGARVADPVSVALGTFIVSVVTNIVSARVDRHILDRLFDRRTTDDLQRALQAAWTKAVDECFVLFCRSSGYATLTQGERERLPGQVKSLTAPDMVRGLFPTSNGHLAQLSSADIGDIAASGAEGANRQLFGVLEALPDWPLLPNGLRTILRRHLLDGLLFNFVEAVVKRDPKARDAVFFQQLVALRRQQGATDAELAVLHAEMRSALEGLAGYRRWEDDVVAMLATVASTTERIETQTERIEVAVGHIADRLTEGQRSEAAERERHLRDEFALIKSIAELRPADLRFEEVQPGGLPTRATSRPFYSSVYIRRALVPFEAPAQRQNLPTYTEAFLAGELRRGNGLVLLGDPLVGKTRTLYHILSLLDNCLLLKPHTDRAVPPDDAFALLQGQRVVLLLDDLHHYARITLDLDAFCRKLDCYAATWAIAATCRSGVIQAEKSELGAVLAARGTGLRDVFDDLPLKLRLLPLTAAEKGQLARGIGRTDWRPALQTMYPTPGHITMGDAMRYMRSRFRELSREQQDTLRAMRLLLDAALLPSPERLSSVLRGFFKRSGINLDDSIHVLAEQGFLFQRSRDLVLPEPAYLLHLVATDENADYPATRDKLAAILEEIADANGLFVLATEWLQQKDWQRALSGYDRALRFRPDDLNGLVGKAVTLGCLGRDDEELAVLDAALQLRPDFAYALLVKGRVLLRLRRDEDALMTTERLLELRPDAAEAWNDKSQTHNRLGQHEEALTTIDRALQLRPNDPDMLVRKGVTLGRLGRPAEAIAVFDRALLLRPDSFDALVNKGAALGELGRHEEALWTLDRALERRGDDAGALANKAMALTSLGQHEEALKVADRAIALQAENPEALVVKSMALSGLGRHNEALVLVSQALELQPDDPGVLVTKGVLLNRRGRHEEALVTLERALNLRANLPEALANKGLALAALGRTEEAFGVYDSALALRPDLVEAWQYKALALGLLGRHQDALVALDRILALRPDDIGPLLQKGVALNDLGRHGDALTVLDRATDLQPDLADAWYNKGIAQSNLGRDNEASVAFNRAIHLDLDHVNLLFEEAKRLKSSEQYETALTLLDRTLHFAPDNEPLLTLKGFALEQLGRLEESLTTLDRALELQPDSFNALLNRGVALGKLGRNEAALETAERALGLQPDEQAALVNKSAALNGLGRQDEALPVLERARHLQPDNPLAWHNTGVALNGLGRYDEALAALDRALILQSEYPDALNSKGRALLGLARYEEALPELDRALALQPEHYGAQYNKGIALAQLRRHAEAKVFLGRARQHPMTFEAAAQAITEFGYDTDN